MQEPSDAIYLASEANEDQWSEIADLIYEKYPNLIGVVDILDLITNLLFAIEEKSLEGGDQVIEYAELVGDIVARFVRGVSKIRGGLVNEG